MNDTTLRASWREQQWGVFVCMVSEKQVHEKAVRHPVPHTFIV